MTTLKALAALLTYPNEELQAALPEIGMALAADRELPAPIRADLARMLEDMEASEVLDIQERYVSLFDRIPSLSLHLFEHVHGDSRDRGMAMVELVEMYKRQGLEIEARELPDYLPLFLEFLSLLPTAEAGPLLADAGNVLTKMGARLAARGSPYAAVFAALAALSGAEVQADSEEPAEDGDGFAQLDKAWEEAAVTFGPDTATQSNTACDPVAAMVARMSAPKGGLPA